MRAAQSNGSAGEEAAWHAFKRLRWRMFKTNPAIKNLGPVKDKPGQFKAVYVEGGVPDFVGHSLETGRAIYCEVKEATPSEGDSVPHSRVSVSQQAFMAYRPEAECYVGILWRDGTFTMFPFRGDRGSYKKRDGIS